MIAEWLRSGLDLILIAVVGAGLWRAGILIRHLAGLRQGKAEMERFVHEFNATVVRAEIGIKGLRNAARESGDDLEKLVEKALLARDELQYLVESGDQIAERLSRHAASAMRPDDKPKAESKPAAPRQAAAPAAEPPAPAQAAAAPASKAEKELLQALQKLT